MHHQTDDNRLREMAERDIYFLNPCYVLQVCEKYDLSFAPPARLDHVRQKEFI